RKQELRLERQWVRHARRGGDLDRLRLERLVEEPAYVLLEDLRDGLEQALGRHTAAVLDHRQVRDRRRCLAVELDAAHGEVLERELVALAQVADLAAHEMRLAQQPLAARHDSFTFVKLTL